MYYTHSNKGFTLIELMIAIVIIGILAAVAVPIYQSYAAKAQFSEAITVSEAAKLNAVNQMITDGSCKQTEGQINASYVQSVATKPLESGCSVTVTFKESGVNSQLANQTVIYTINELGDTVNWKCETTISQDIATNCQSTTNGNG